VKAEFANFHAVLCRNTALPSICLSLLVTVRSNLFSNYALDWERVNFLSS